MIMLHIHADEFAAGVSIAALTLCVGESGRITPASFSNAVSSSNLSFHSLSDIISACPE